MESLEKDGLVTRPRDEIASRSAELTSLRRELLVRIVFQNALLLISVVIFLFVAWLSFAHQDQAWTIAFAHGVTVLAMVLQWCHHGVRTKQIKEYLLSIYSEEHGWERWLPAHRPNTLLGSRWLVSTKGVFLGLGLASMLLAELLDAPRDTFPLVLALGLWLASALFLFTNPKE